MAYITIIRPLNCMITLLAVWVGAWINKGIYVSPVLVIAGIIGFASCAFGNIVNDLYDIEIDRINNPQRPLPAGKVNKKILCIQAAFLLVLALLLALSINCVVFLLVLGVCSTLFLYAAWLKKTCLANVIVSLTTGMSLVLGGIVANNPVALYPFIFSFFIHLPREIIKDVIDIKGDELNNVASLPIIFGTAKASYLAALLLAILCLFLPIPYITKVLSLRYMIIVFIIAYPIIIYCMVRLLKKPAAREYPKFSKLIKVVMAAGLVAMII